MIHDISLIFFGAFLSVGTWELAQRNQTKFFFACLCVAAVAMFVGLLTR